MRVERLVQKLDFERVLGAPLRARSPHFALHHVAARPVRRRPAGACAAAGDQLSTAVIASLTVPVDDLPPDAVWLGLVVPKRHARRAVTRTLLKRQIRVAMRTHAPRLPAGLWVVRLRAPFDPRHFRSAASDALRDAARHELERVVRAAAVPPTR